MPSTPFIAPTLQMGSDAWVPVTPYHTCLSFVAFNLPPVIDMKS